MINKWSMKSFRVTHAKKCCLSSELLANLALCPRLEQLKYECIQPYDDRYLTSNDIYDLMLKCKGLNHICIKMS